jgi:hypothetical protein
MPKKSKPNNESWSSSIAFGLWDAVSIIPKFLFRPPLSVVIMECPKHKWEDVMKDALKEAMEN